MKTVRVAFFAKDGPPQAEALEVVDADAAILLRRHLSEIAFRVSRARPDLEGRELRIDIGATADGYLQLTGCTAGGERLAVLTVDPLSVDAGPLARAFARRRPDLQPENVVFGLLPEPPALLRAPRPQN